MSGTVLGGGIIKANKTQASVFRSLQSSGTQTSSGALLESVMGSQREACEHSRCLGKSQGLTVPHFPHLRFGLTTPTWKVYDHSHFILSSPPEPNLLSPAPKSRTFCLLSASKQLPQSLKTDRRKTRENTRYRKSSYSSRAVYHCYKH